MLLSSFWVSPLARWCSESWISSAWRRNELNSLLISRRNSLDEYMWNEFLAAKKKFWMNAELTASIMTAVTSSFKRGFSVADVQQSTANIARRIRIFSCVVISCGDFLAFSSSRWYAFSMLASSWKARKALITTKHQCQQSTVIDGGSRCKIFQMMSNRVFSSSSKQLSRCWQKMKIPDHLDAWSADSPNNSSIAWIRRVVVWLRTCRWENKKNNYEVRQILSKNLPRIMLKSFSKKNSPAQRENNQFNHLDCYKSRDYIELTAMPRDCSK